MKIWIELPEQNDVETHARAHANDAIADRTPYGLHHLADSGDDTVRFRRPLEDARLAWLARKVRNRLGSHEVIAGAVSLPIGDRRESDAVLCMDERTGFPAALAPGGPPVVSNIVWVRRPETYSPAARAIIGRALRRLAVVFTQARSLNAELLDGWGLDPERVMYARLGVDPEFFSAQPWTEGSMTVASVGDDPYRDHGLLIESVRRLRSTGTPARLELGTTIPGVELPDPEMGILHRRRMEGDVRAMYRRSAVVALAAQPSNRGTGSTVVLEAAASGRPVVATRNPAMDDLVADGERGLLVPPGDPEAFSEALRTLLADPERAKAMGKAARAWLEREHTTVRMSQDIRAALDRGLTLGRPR